MLEHKNDRLKVLIVDDEPYILQGLQVLFDWKAEGYEIAAALSNGKEALDYLKENEVDLILSDIKMPVMTGLELLETIRKEHISDAKFVILTGYDDFSYAQKAIRFKTLDYILKPVQKEDLLSLLRNVSKQEIEKFSDAEERKKHEDAYLARNIRALLKGKFGEENLAYVKKHLLLGDNIRYVDIEVVGESVEEDENDLRQLQVQLFNACREVMKDSAKHFIFDVSYDENNYDIGFIFCDNMAGRLDKSEAEYFEDMLVKLKTSLLKNIRITCGKVVNDLSQLAKSYSSCCMLNSILGFRSEKNIYFYEDEIQTDKNASFLCNSGIDAVISAIQDNDKDRIVETVEKLYQEMNQQAEGVNAVTVNTNYLLFQLIHIATHKEDQVNQEEVIKYITEHSISKTITRGSTQHMISFAQEFADYLASLKGQVSRGLISSIEKEIEEHYRDNITLKSLGDKYYINSSYLGQLFRKAHDMSFKDYLTKVRVEKAVNLLVSTSEKIERIAEEVGYSDSDYFIRKFIELKGCTPSKYRRNNSVH
mgnify:FL=1